MWCSSPFINEIRTVWIFFMWDPLIKSASQGFFHVRPTNKKSNHNCFVSMNFFYLLILCVNGPLIFNPFMSFNKKIQASQYQWLTDYYLAIQLCDCFKIFYFLFFPFKIQSSTSPIGSPPRPLLFLFLYFYFLFSIQWLLTLTSRDSLSIFLIFST